MNPLKLAALCALALSPSVALAQPTGTVFVRLIFNPTPSTTWEAGQSVTLSADARRNPRINQEDIFWRQAFPGAYPRTAGQAFDVSIPNVKPGDKIILQGYMCSQTGGDCYPSDKDNPPSCSVQLHVLGNFRPKCQPEFTWTGGGASGGVLCQATCR